MRTVRMILALLLVFAAAALLPAQTPPPSTTAVQTPPPGAPAQTPAPGRAGGGGRGGRGGTVIMTLTAPWAPGAEIPLKHTQAGGEVSPALSWDNPPETVVSFALIVHDISAPVNPGTDDVLHWMVWNIPAASRGLPEGVARGSQLPDGMRQISVTGPNYRGPGALASGPPHVYVFELFALDSMIDVPALGPTGATVPQIRAAVMTAMATHVRGKAVTAGVFKRK
ncbi:MAG TPA: YbhB/YbcL family Raf kinase inhibitor-like protein [Vicinamibacterales bacterium]|nr:YbhB/YbcL family Raf kinase inhibitor-like protein [Vicinamibacterales bacterium]